MGFTTTAAGTLLRNQIGSSWVGLSTTAPAADGSGFTEPSAAFGYERAPVGALDESRAAQVANDAIIFFNESLGAWGTVTHFGLFRSRNDNKPFFTGELSMPVVIESGYVPIFRAKNLVVGLDKTSLESYS